MGNTMFLLATCIAYGEYWAVKQLSFKWLIFAGLLCKRLMLLWLINHPTFEAQRGCKLLDSLRTLWNLWDRLTHFSWTHRLKLSFKTGPAMSVVANEKMLHFESSYHIRKWTSLASVMRQQMIQWIPVFICGLAPADASSIDRPTDRYIMQQIHVR